MINSCSGVLLVAIRIFSDNYLYSAILNDLKITSKKLKYEHISSFANSAMNIEFVYIILTAINKFNKDENSVRSNTIRVSKNENHTEIFFKNIDVSENLDCPEGRISFAELSVNSNIVSTDSLNRLPSGALKT